MDAAVSAKRSQFANHLICNQMLLLLLLLLHVYYVIETASRRPPHPVWFQACTVRGRECGIQWSLVEYSQLC